MRITLAGLTWLSVLTAGAVAAVAGTVNTGGGGGGGGSPNQGGGNGGSGIVILRIPAACAPGSLAAAPGTNTITTLPAPAGGCKIATFTVDGTLTV